MTTELSHLRTRWGPAAATVAVAVLAALSAVLLGRELAHREAEGEVRAAAADAVAPVSDAIRTAIDDAAVGRVSSARQVRIGNAGSAGISTTTAIRARDTGLPVLDDSGQGAVVVAIYDTGVVPASVDERRTHVSTLRVVPLMIAPTMSGLAPQDGGISLSGPDRTVLSLPGAAPPDVPAYTAEIAPGRATLPGSATSTPLAPDWSLTVWTAPAATPLGAWAAAFVILLVGLGVAAWLVRRADRARRSRQELQRMQRASARVASLATVAQHSLDLADVLPTVTTELSTALGLRGLSLAAPTAAGDRSFFAWGELPDEPPAPGPLPNEVAAGDAVSLLLTRGGRTVARLVVMAGRDLDRHDLESLNAAAEVLTSSLANADAFAQQRDLLRRMRSLDELKTVFLATASHELRTPVTAITGYARVLADSWERLTPEQARTYADRVDTNAQRLGALVEDLLDFSRLERGISAVADDVLDLGETVNQILAEQPDLVTDHQLLTKTAPGLLVKGSQQAVERVVSNLVGNAAKYSPAGTTIRVSVRKKAGRAQLSVADEGPGVPAPEREQIFSRFYRGGGDEVVTTRGAGLGLAIVNDFASSMGGEVSVAAADSGGALFVVSYPLAGARDDLFEGEPDVDP